MSEEHGGPADDAARHRALSSPRRAAILTVLHDVGGAVSVEQVAERVGLHPNTAREHLEVLVAAGLASRTAEARASRGRPRTLYAAHDVAESDRGPWLRDQLSRVLLAGYGRPLDEPGSAAQRAAELLAAGPGPEAAEAVAPAGSPARVPGGADLDDPEGARQRQLAALHAHLAGLGFDPEQRGDEVRLRRCPVLDLAHERSDVVCGVHLGLARGVLARTGGPVSATGIRPFAEPGWCVLQLTGVAPAPGPTSEAAPTPG